MQTYASDAVDISKESAATQKLYVVGEKPTDYCDDVRYCWLIRHYPVQAALGAIARNGDSRVCSSGGPSHQAPSRRWEEMGKSFVLIKRAQFVAQLEIGIAFWLRSFCDTSRFFRNGGQINWFERHQFLLVQ